MCWEGSSFMWHQPCQRCKYNTSVDIHSYIITCKLSESTTCLDVKILLLVVNYVSVCVSTYLPDPVYVTQQGSTFCMFYYWSLLYSAILCSRAGSLRLHVILHEWLAFYSTFLNIHRSGVLTALAWLVPHETAAISHVLCTPYNHATSCKATYVRCMRV